MAVNFAKLKAFHHVPIVEISREVSVFVLKCIFGTPKAHQECCQSLNIERMS